MDYAICYDWLKWKYGQIKQINLILTSECPDTASYLNSRNKRGSCYMDIDGRIFVTINDVGGATGSTWIEEVMHAKQYIDRGHIEFACTGGESDDCEMEIARCVLTNQSKLHLPDSEIEYYQDELEVHGAES